jgi:hypothetical protein
MVGEFGVDFDVVCCTLMWVSSGVSRINPSAIYRIPIPLAILDPSQQSADLTRSHKPEMACLPLAQTRLRRLGFPVDRSRRTFSRSGFRAVLCLSQRHHHGESFHSGLFSLVHYCWLAILSTYNRSTICICIVSVSIPTYITLHNHEWRERCAEPHMFTLWLIPDAAEKYSWSLAVERQPKAVTDPGSCCFNIPISP